ncbi:MAG: diaminopimelate epimerase [Elusimicrobiales bacterium]|nr:diaminopimelate epimerase [Elusimicrobiales bacterium]
MHTFYKLTASGNDFILFYNLDERPIILSKLAKKVCDRHYGIGADGILALERKNGSFFLRYFNSDGSQAFCGNGTRACAFWLRRRFSIKNDFYILTSAGKLLCLNRKGKELIEMPKPLNFKRIVLPKNDKFKIGYYVFAGTQHLVLFVDKVGETDVLKYGKFFRYHPLFQPKGVNVNFVELLFRKKSFIKAKIRTYEKGVENETLSCASGNTSAFYVLENVYGIKKAEFINKGNSKLRFIKNNDKLFVSGPVNIICRGVLFI